MKRRAKVKVVESHVTLIPAERLYAKLCAQCRAGREPVRRQISPGVFMWLHDSVAACGAHVEREKAKQEAAIAAQKS